MLFLNRRGTATFIMCRDCGYIALCPRCNTPLTYHGPRHALICHYCGHTQGHFETCPDCGSKRIKHFGQGTELIEAAVQSEFPTARTIRWDRDTATGREAHEFILQHFSDRHADILIGTQMIAKGLDFPFVSFVGIVSADTALGLNDFRSEERTFQLVLQVAGRSGRGDAPGHVVVQTFAADADPIRHAVAGNYEAFADGELQKRRRAKLPPWTRMMRIIIADPLYTKLQKAGDALKQELDAALERRGIAASVFGPSPCPIKRLRDSYRMDIQLTFDTAGAMLSAIDLFKSEGTLKSSVKTLTVDVDPVSLQ